MSTDRFLGTLVEWFSETGSLVTLIVILGVLAALYYVRGFLVERGKRAASSQRRLPRILKKLVVPVLVILVGFLALGQLSEPLVQTEAPEPVREPELEEPAEETLGEIGSEGEAGADGSEAQSPTAEPPEDGGGADEPGPAEPQTSTSDANESEPRTDPPIDPALPAETPPATSSPPDSGPRSEPEASLGLVLAIQDGALETLLRQELRSSGVTVSSIRLGTEAFASPRFDRLRFGDPATMASVGLAEQSCLVVARIERGENRGRPTSAGQFVSAITVRGGLVEAASSAEPFEFVVRGTGGTPETAFEHARERVPTMLLRMTSLGARIKGE